MHKKNNKDVSKKSMPRQYVEICSSCYGEGVNIDGGECIVCKGLGELTKKVL